MTTCRRCPCECGEYLLENSPRAGRETSDESEDDRRADVSEAESLIRRYGRDAGSPTQNASGDGAMIFLTQTDPHPHVMTCVNCGVYEFLQDSTEMCCGARRGRRCVFPGGDGNGPERSEGKNADGGAARERSESGGMNGVADPKRRASGEEEVDGDEEMNGRSLKR